MYNSAKNAYRHVVTTIRKRTTLSPSQISLCISVSKMSLQLQSIGSTRSLSLCSFSLSCHKIGLYHVQTFWVWHLFFNDIYLRFNYVVYINSLLSLLPSNSIHECTSIVYSLNNWRVFDVFQFFAIINKSSINIFI